MLWIRHISFSLVILLLLTACTAGTTISPSATPQVTPSPIPPTASPRVTADTELIWPTQGWAITTPEEQDMDSQRLQEVVMNIEQQDYAIDAVLVVRNGVIVLDEAFPPYDQADLHVVNSCTKSVVSILIGIAIEEGYLDGVDQKLIDIFPDRIPDNLDAGKALITLEDVLTMSSGLDCQDSWLYRWQGIRDMWDEDDWVQYMLDLPMAHDPGTYFEYCNGGSFLLSAIISEKTGMSTLAYADDKLFRPLGIEEVAWPTNPQGINFGWGELEMKPHDMAKIGFLFLNEGRWDEEQIVSADWVEASTQAHIAANLSDGYGYQWWVDQGGYYMALGYAGQFIYVIPEKNMVVVFVSDLPEDQFFVPEGLLVDLILPAAQ